MGWRQGGMETRWDRDKVGQRHGERNINII